jgi:hypothetical protein
MKKNIINIDELGNIAKYLEKKDRAAVAKEFNVNKSTISHILEGRFENIKIKARLAEIAVENKKRKVELKKNLKCLNEPSTNPK